MLNSFIFVTPGWCTTTEGLNKSVDEDEDQFLIALATHKSDFSCHIGYRDQPFKINDTLHTVRTSELKTKE